MFIANGSFTLYYKLYALNTRYAPLVLLRMHDHSSEAQPAALKQDHRLWPLVQIYFMYNNSNTYIYTV